MHVRTTYIVCGREREISPRAGSHLCFLRYIAGPMFMNIWETQRYSFCKEKKKQRYSFGYLKLSKFRTTKYILKTVKGPIFKPTIVHVLTYSFFKILTFVAQEKKSLTFVLHGKNQNLAKCNSRCKQQNRTIVRESLNTSCIRKPVGQEHVCLSVTHVKKKLFLVT